MAKNSKNGKNVRTNKVQIFKSEGTDKLNAAAAQLASIKVEGPMSKPTVERIHKIAGLLEKIAAQVVRRYERAVKSQERSDANEKRLAARKAALQSKLDKLQATLNALGA